MEVIPFLSTLRLEITTMSVIIVTSKRFKEICITCEKIKTKVAFIFSRRTFFCILHVTLHVKIFSMNISWFVSIFQEKGIIFQTLELYLNRLECKSSFHRFNEIYQTNSKMLPDRISPESRIYRESNPRKYLVAETAGDINLPVHGNARTFFSFIALSLDFPFSRHFSF